MRTHPETGRKALYTSDAHTAHIKGWTEKESLPLLRFLWEHQTRPEFTCRFRWEAGSLAFWDNRCAMHNPINDYHGYPARHAPDHAGRRQAAITEENACPTWAACWLCSLLVAANGFFVAAEFSLVAVRRSRVMELAAAGRMNAKALVRALDHLDSNLAATQLGITISSLALGWIGEPAIGHLIETPLDEVWGSTAGISAYAIAVGISFVIITALHIVLGELAPKSLALQRSESTALWVVRPLGLFLWLFGRRSSC